jgi:hypothetical protein
MKQSKAASTYLRVAAANTRFWRSPSQYSRPLLVGVFQSWEPTASSGEEVRHPLSAALPEGSSGLHGWVADEQRQEQTPNTCQQQQRLSDLDAPGATAALQNPCRLLPWKWAEGAWQGPCELLNVLIASLQARTAGLHPAWKATLLRAAKTSTAALK